MRTRWSWHVKEELKRRLEGYRPVMDALNVLGTTPWCAEGGLLPAAARALLLEGGGSVLGTTPWLVAPPPFGGWLLGAREALEERFGLRRRGLSAAILTPTDPATPPHPPPNPSPDASIALYTTPWRRSHHAPRSPVLIHPSPHPAPPPRRINRPVYDAMAALYGSRSTAAGLPVQEPIKPPRPLGAQAAGRGLGGESVSSCPQSVGVRCRTGARPASRHPPPSQNPALSTSSPPPPSQPAPLQKKAPPTG
jgi:hypothetical protein